MRTILTTLVLLPIFLISLAIGFAPTVQQHLDVLSQDNGVSVVERVELTTLFSSMIAIGRIPFPESADNLAMLFINTDHEDYVIWPSYLALSYSIRSGIAQADATSALHNKKISNINTKFIPQDKRNRHTLSWNPKSWYTIEPRIAYLYNPWSSRVKDLGLFRQVTIFQWMHFSTGDTPIGPFTIRDGLVHNVSPDGELNAFTAYASWIEPKIPHSILLPSTLLLHNLMRAVLGFLLLGLPVLFGHLLFSNNDTRRNTVGKVLVALGTIGTTWAVVRGLWDVVLGLLQIASMMGTDSKSLLEPYDIKFYAANPRLDSAPSDTILSPIGWSLWRVAFNIACYTVCKKIVDFGQQIHHSPSRKQYIIGALCTLFPWVGLPFPIIVMGFPLGVWLLWMIDTQFRQSQTQ